MVSSSCSTTISVLSRSRRCISVFSSRSLSRGCRPIEGSSSTYSTPVRPLPTWVASRMRCASCQCVRGPVEGQVVEAGVLEETEPLVDLAHDRPGHLAGGTLEVEVAEEGDRIKHRHVRHLGVVAAGYRDCQHFGLVAAAVAVRAGDE